MKLGFVTILNGPLHRQRFRFIRSLTLGREKQNTVRLLDPKVSRTHARIDATEQGFRIKDLNSTNGTFINGAQVQNSLLKPGDRIRMGFTLLHFMHRDILNLEDIGDRGKIATERKLVDAERDEEAVAGAHQHLDPRELQRRFAAILRINRTIGSQLDIKRAFERILDEIFLMFPADRGALLSVNENTGRLEIVCSRTRKGPVDVDDILISQTILNKVLEDSVGLLIDDDNPVASVGAVDPPLDQIRSALCVPLIQNGEVIGIIYLDVANERTAFKEDDLDLLMAVAGPASVQVQNTLYVTQLKKSYLDTIRALANAVEARDRYTIGHHRRVSRLATVLAGALGWSDHRVRLAELGGILHDIGKIGISDTIMLKREPLDQKEEKRMMQRHPEIGARMIMGIDFLRPIIPFVLYHHESYEGGGYPFGLKGKEIPQEGRLLAVCDAFDAMTSTRPYRKRLEPHVAIEELRRGMESQFDPHFVQSFVEAWEAGKVDRALNEPVEDQDAMVDLFPANYLPYSS
jgi:putative nucleotidyltransferase with HDIG domain